MTGASQRNQERTVTLPILNQTEHGEVLPVSCQQKLQKPLWYFGHATPTLEWFFFGWKAVNSQIFTSVLPPPKHRLWKNDQLAPPRQGERDRLCRSAAKCDTYCELLNIDTSPTVIASQIPSARVINTLYITCNIKVVAEQELQSTECLEWKDRILRELIQLICSCQEVHRAAELHKRRRPQ